MVFTSRAEIDAILAKKPDHECHIDCDPTMGGHMMYPVTEITWTRNQYGPHNMTRREWREYSGGLETRNVREWNYNRERRVNGLPLAVPYRNGFLERV